MGAIAKIKRVRGDTQGALAVADECKKRIEPFHKPHWAYMLDAFIARLHLDLRNDRLVEKWLEESRLSIFQEITEAREYELIVLVRVMIRKMRYDDAYLLLGRLMSFAEKNNRTHSSVEILNLLAITALKDLNEAAALQYAEKALHIGLKEGYVRSFADELSPMAVLLKLYMEKGKNNAKLTAYAKRLLQSAEKSIRYSMPPIDSDADGRLLTRAENDILLLISKALTNAEIASELRITLNTVKAHTRSIYKKLGVKNRMQCMKKVRETSG
jgi:LuxR family maltose regulon positive regulatory protein